ncbi:methylenetetrahydrofolate reductase [Anaerolineales bacterium]
MNISIEIVPRDQEHILKELETVKSLLGKVNTINVPDIPRFKTRSWQGACIAKAHFNHVIPHIRAVDFNPALPFLLKEDLQEAGIDSILIVTGDAPKTSFAPVYRNDSIGLIKQIKKEMPEIRVYAAIDPYRQGLQAEYAYIQEKLEAGADGFFTQPFFDLNLMNVYADFLAGLDIYWGVAPVTNDKSKAYWETTNRVVFPKGFQVDLAGNREFAIRALEMVTAMQHHIYFMPIRTDLEGYLSGIL